MPFGALRSDLATTSVFVIVSTGIALCVVVLVVSLLFWSRKRVPAGGAKDRSARLTPTQTIDLSVTPAKGLVLAEKAVRAAGRSNVAVDAALLTVVGRTGMTWRSWGQALAVTVEEEHPSGCRLICSSWPTYPLQMVDWGAGKLALQKLVDQIELLIRQN
jgi:hypothetical protein